MPGGLRFLQGEPQGGPNVQHQKVSHRSHCGKLHNARSEWVDEQWACGLWPSGWGQWTHRKRPFGAVAKDGFHPHTRERFSCPLVLFCISVYMFTYSNYIYIYLFYISFCKFMLNLSCLLNIYLYIYIYFRFFTFVALSGRSNFFSFFTKILGIKHQWGPSAGVRQTSPLERAAERPEGGPTVANAFPSSLRCQFDWLCGGACPGSC